MFRDNLFIAIKALEAVATNKMTSSAHYGRLQKMLNGDERNKGLYDLARGFNKDSYRYLLNEVALFYQATSPIEFSLKLALKRMKTVLANMVNADHSKNNNQFSPRQSAYARMQDDIYKQTVEKYDGMIVAPMAQLLDYRLANSSGECAGYVIVWAQSLLSKKNPFGIRHEQGPLFKPVPFNSAIGRKYPDLNHTIVLTPKIAEYQKKNKKTLYDCEGSRKIYRAVVNLPAFYKQGADIGKVLVKLAAQNSKTIYYLSLHNGVSAHALGFYLDEKSNYHLFDVNTGWFKFQSQDLFCSWLDFYFQQKKYNESYGEFLIRSYGFERPSKMSLSNWINIQGGFLANRFRHNEKVDDFALIRANFSFIS